MNKIGTIRESNGHSIVLSPSTDWQFCFGCVFCKSEENYGHNLVGECPPSYNSVDLDCGDNVWHYVGVAADTKKAIIPIIPATPVVVKRELVPHKHADLIKAWADGHPIQCDSGRWWLDVSHPEFDENLVYRVKPENTMIYGALNHEKTDIVPAASQYADFYVEVDCHGEIVNIGKMNDPD